MLWVFWRQHRAELAVVAAALLAVVTVLVITGLRMHDVYHSTGVPACLRDTTEGNCGTVIIAFRELYAPATRSLVGVGAVPALLGALLGAPMLARELERGTWKLAFTQSVSRRRWLATKMGMSLAVVLALVAALTAVLTWWRGPLDAVEGRLAAAFHLEGLSLVGGTLFAFALGTLAGVLTRRVVPAIALTLAGYGAVWLLVSNVLRPRYLTPRMTSYDLTDRYRLSSQPLYNHDWVLDTGHLDSAGRRLPDGKVSALIDSYLANPTEVPPDTDRHLASLGIRGFLEYQPASHFWTFQFIEAAIYLGLAASAVLTTFWLLRRRTA